MEFVARPLVVYFAVLFKEIFRNVAKRAMPNVVKQGRQPQGIFIFLSDLHALFSQAIQYSLSDVESSQGVLESCVYSAGVDEISHGELPNAPEPLHRPGIDNLQFAIGNTD